MREAMEASVIKPLSQPWHQPFLRRVAQLKQQQRLAHAILLSLPGQSNALALIWQLSMLLLCQQSQNEKPCGQCTACRLMIANTYPDFKLLSLELNEKTKKMHQSIKVQQVRDLIHEVYLTHSYDYFKLFVIYPADRMSLSSANSLLKTLEEPAERVLIILATHCPGKIPVTICSRCQLWTLGPPSAQEALAWLQDQGLETAIASRSLELAAGDPAFALTLMETGYLELVETFKPQFSRYLQDRLGVDELCTILLGSELSQVRNLISMVIKAYCYQYSGIQGPQGKGSAYNKSAAREMLRLSGQADRQLMVEENNLDLQLQLSDVLISMKQIINRSHQNGRTEPRHIINQH